MRKLLLSEESIANLKKFLMRYWYTVIFIVLGVFSLMAIIIKICGKKTPLVHSRRKRRRQTIQHGAEYSRNSDNPTDIQVKFGYSKKATKFEKVPDALLVHRHLYCAWCL